jgi:2'-phosphotransferase
MKSSSVVATDGLSSSNNEHNHNLDDSTNEINRNRTSNINSNKRSRGGGGAGRHHHYHQDDKSDHGGRGTRSGGWKGNNSASNKNKSNNNSSNNLRKLSHALSWVLRHSAIEIGLPLQPDGYVPVQEILNCQHPRLKGIAISLEQIKEVVATSDKQRYRLEERPKHLYYPQPPPVVPKNSITPPITDTQSMCGGRDDNATVASTTTTETVLCIRANQGHSITMIRPDLLLCRLGPNELLAHPCIVHGTYIEVWKSAIEREGLHKMTRTHIHFATGLPNSCDDNGGGGVISGMRKSCSVYIYLDIPACASATTDGSIDFYKSDNGVILTAGVDNTGILPPKYFSHVIEASSGNLLMDNRRTNIVDHQTQTTPPSTSEY